MYVAVRGDFTYNLTDCCIFSTLLTKISVWSPVQAGFRN